MLFQGMIVALVRRTQIEDEMLQAELPGYPEYAARALPLAARVLVIRQEG